MRQLAVVLTVGKDLDRLTRTPGLRLIRRRRGHQRRRVRRARCPGVRTGAARDRAQLDRRAREGQLPTASTSRCPSKYVGKGGGAEATPEYLASLIPQGHRELGAQDARRRRRAAAARRLRARRASRRPVSTSTRRARGSSRSPSTTNVKMVVNAPGRPRSTCSTRKPRAGVLVGGRRLQAARRAPGGHGHRRHRRPGHRGRWPLRRDQHDGARAAGRRRSAPTCPCSYGGIHDDQRFQPTSHADRQVAEELKYFNGLNHFVLTTNHCHVCATWYSTRCLSKHRLPSKKRCRTSHQQS